MLEPPRGPDAFPRERLEMLIDLERWHFWFTARRDLTLRLLGREAAGRALSILDAGCGSGSMVQLVQRGHRVTGLDLRPEGLSKTRREVPTARLVRAEATQLPFTESAFDAILLLDLLEHVDDETLLGEAARVLRPGGFVLLTAPAFPWLWSHRDEAAGHLRRYTRKGLKSLLERAHLPAHDLSYYQCLLFPLVALGRLAGRGGPALRDLEDRPRPWINAILGWVNRLEVRAGGRVRWPFGSSLVAVARKGMG